ncbi:MAG: DUF2442 domain-containing protein [Campylobacterales bacterium]|nr:DUF2442 domain-containing protein [Campylobacterales bacterium]
MKYLVTSAKYLKDYEIELVFKDGKVGIVDLKDYKNRGGVFEGFKNLDYFKNFETDGITLTWQDEVDIAPERLYEISRSL